VNGPPQIALFLGRLHVLLVHLPIGLIVLVACLELLARFTRFKHANGSSGVILLLAVPLSAFTALCGWLLSLGGGYETRLLQWHLWSGIATAAACAVTALLYRLNLQKTYRFCLASTVLMVIVAGHFGGSLTHGSDYLVRYAPAPLRGLLAWTVPHPAKGSQEKKKESSQPADPKNLPAFAAVVQPVLTADCVSCHGPEKAKAALRLDSFAALMKGSENGTVVVPGKSADSVLVKRLLLTLEDEDHMPPQGKPQPSADDLALLQWWIDAGASVDKKVSELKPPAKIERIVASRFGTATPVVAVKTLPPKPLSEILPVASKLSEELNLAITPLSQAEPWLQCNAAVAGTNFGDAALAKLAVIGPNLRWLDLAGTRISDAGLAPIAAMSNLKRLHLERTGVTDAGLAVLSGLAGLEYLNLYGTEVTDAGLDSLEKLPALKQIYLWQTKVTPSGAKTFADARTDKDQVQRWQEEIEKLKAQIKDQQTFIDLGSPLTAGTPTNSTPTGMTNAAAMPINTVCPVSGKIVDASKTVVYEGRVVAFCCDDCKAEFEKDPKPFLAKLSSTPKRGAGKGKAGKAAKAQ
jgi:YHS domain-containing protein